MQITRETLYPHARDPHAVQQERVNSNAVNQEEEEEARGRPTSNTSFRESNLKHVVFHVFPKKQEKARVHEKAQERKLKALRQQMAAAAKGGGGR